MYDHTLEAAQTLSDPRRTLHHGTLGRGDANATTTGGLGRRGGVFGQGLVIGWSGYKRGGGRREERRACFSKLPRGESLQQAPRGSVRRG